MPGQTDSLGILTGRSELKNNIVNEHKFKIIMISLLASRYGLGLYRSGIPSGCIGSYPVSGSLNPEIPGPDRVTSDTNTRKGPHT